MRILLAVRESIVWILKLFSERQGQNELRESGSLPLGGTRRVGGLLGVAGRLSPDVEEA